MRNIPRVIGSTVLYKLPVDTIVTGSEIVIEQAGRREWLKLDDGGYAATIYPNLVGTVITRLEIPPKPRVLYRVLHDYETAPRYLPRSINPDWGLPDDVGYPETVKAFDSHFTALTESWQRFWYAQMRLSHPTLAELVMKKAWGGLTHSGRAFTNGHGTDKNRDYIRGLNSNASLPGIETIVTGGNVVRGEQEPVNIRGEWFVKIETLDGNKPAPAVSAVNRQLTPWFVHVATTSTPFILPDGTYRVNPFPQLDGRDVPYPLVAKRTVYLPLARLRVVAGIPRAYNP